MKICILGNYSGRLDEGMGNVAYNLFERLQQRYHNNVLLLNVNQVTKLSFWLTLICVRPTIVHYIPGPSVKSLLLVKVIKIITRSYTITSATQPNIHERSLKALLKIVEPDIVLVQSVKSEALFEKLRYKTKFIPNGVDTKRFVPPSKEKKEQLRKKYGFNKEDFVILHIGPLKNGRNQKVLTEIKHSKVLLIVSITNPSEEDVYKDLLKTNVIIWKKYIENIEEIYQISDVYVWPSIKEFHGIEIPLTVLEAMSCNLPVVSTHYGALNRIFEPSEGLIFVKNEDQIREAIEKIKNENISVNTRQMVLGYSWDAITDQIENVYRDLSEKKKNL